MNPQQPALNHVYMWTEHGWKHVTANTIEPTEYTVSHHSGLFMCGLCGRYVTLTKEGKYRRYFKHEIDGTNRCPELTSGTCNGGGYNLDPRKHDLPLRLILSKNDFSFELGLLYVPGDILDSQPFQKVTISTSDGRNYTYNFERLNDGITYLHVGNVPSEYYRVDAPKALRDYWPAETSGVNFESGNVFDSVTGNKIPEDGNVQADRKYYVLTRWTISSSSHGVRINYVLCSNGWRVYEIEALAISQDAANFFLSLHCRLTDSPLNVNMLWPLHAEMPYAVKYSGNFAVFHAEGMRDLCCVKSFPKAEILKFRCISGGNVIKIFPHGRQQMIYSGTLGIIDYAYLWREELPRRTLSPIITITDGKDNIIQPGEHSQLPGMKTVAVCAEFDGYVVTRMDNVITGRHEIFSGENFWVSDICYGMSISVLQGLDEIVSVSFVKDDDRDEKLLARLRAFRGNIVTVPRNISSIYSKLANFPKVREWIYRSARKGVISEDALRLLRKYIMLGGDLV